MHTDLPYVILFWYNCRTLIYLPLKCSERPDKPEVIRLAANILITKTMVPRNDDDPQGVMPCFFPVDAAPDSRKITTKTTDTIRLPLRNAQDTRHQLFTTWAILLHFYTGNDFVTFCSTGFEEQQLHGTISGESKSWAQRDPSILRYEFRGNSPICQLRPIQLRHSSSGMRAINTGVKHSYDEDAPFDTSSTLETSAVSGVRPPCCSHFV